MRSDSTKSLILPVAVTLTVLLGAYVGAYYWLVQPGFFWAFGDGLDPVPSFPTYPKVADEQAHARVERFFAPIHRLDRRMRPQVWGPD